MRLAFLLVLATATPVAAQDVGFDPLLFAGMFDGTAENVQARATQLYRLPISLTLRKPAEGRVGVRLTVPISLTSVRVENISDVKPFVTKMGVAAIVPGIELMVPVNDRFRLRPFFEAGIGRGGGRTEVLYGAGVRARVDRAVDQVQLTFGGSAMYRKSGTSADEYGSHSLFEAAVDTQVPLGFSVGSRKARGGIYVMARALNGLEMPLANQNPAVLRSQFEVGASFSTSPELNIWKLRLPWLAAGYQFGDTLSTVRFYLRFPF